MPGRVAPRRVASWSGGAETTTESNQRPGWLDTVAIVVGLVIVDAAVLFAISFFAPSGAACGTYNNCIAEPHAEIHNAYVRMIVFGAFALVSVVVVWWRRRPVVVLVAIVQALAVSLILVQGFATVHDQQHRLQNFHGCRFLRCVP